MISIMFSSCKPSKLFSEFPVDLLCEASLKINQIAFDTSMVSMAKDHFHKLLHYNSVYICMCIYHI